MGPLRIGGASRDEPASRAGGYHTTPEAPGLGASRGTLLTASDLSSRRLFDSCHRHSFVGPRLLLDLCPSPPAFAYINRGVLSQWLLPLVFAAFVETAYICLRQFSYLVPRKARLCVGPSF
ncbi:hypothetical protein PCANC_21509 [Puccinia coronata f. sp. avenae]|uniref:Uncharacterized protein n=1 Tax=Puccinia coronata f. sp. avenae TaxID=200324 RepID=A0A2N5TVD6_9BASI|nr:hypothetical protein PCASD_23530 [Puccinia coronata f. sp. avenae]PLW08985.1 hypothetical protein PCANC_21509 [Puccinia coronata f. sp. avenae]PLW29439.1 hypothetical protein PCASD_18405 [Puccinia coronata f. sp. avenae]